LPIICLMSSYPLSRPQIIPEGNSQVVIFPLDRKTFKIKTSHWNSRTLTSDRLTDHEFRLFMKEVNEYLAVYETEFGFLYSSSFTVLMIICCIFLPALPFFLCYVSTIRKRATRMVILYKQKLNGLAHMTNMTLVPKDLMWVIPKDFPDWVELWTSARSQSAIADSGNPVIEMVPAENTQQVPQYPGFQQYQYQSYQQHQYQQNLQYQQIPQSHYPIYPSTLAANDMKASDFKSQKAQNEALFS